MFYLQNKVLHFFSNVVEKHDLEIWMDGQTDKHLSFYSAQPSALSREVIQLKQPLIVGKIPKDDPLVLSLKQKYSLR